MEFKDLEDYSIKPILYYDVLSSHARSCQMLISILKIDVDLQTTDSMEDLDFNETYIWLNSFCRLPTLVDGDVTLCNGHSILIYLCQKYASKNLPNLCPCDYLMRQKITSLLYYEACTLNRHLTNLLTDILLGKYPNFDVDYHKRKVTIAYNSLNTFLNRHPFMIGSRLTIADISIVSTVSALNIIFPIDYNKFQNLFDWLNRLKKTNFYKLNEEGLLKLRYILKNVGKFPFPSPYNNEEENTEFEIETANEDANITTSKKERNSNTNDLENLSDFEKPLTSSSAKRIENDSHLEQRNRVESENQNQERPGRVNEDTEKFSFHDTYFINVSKCICCHSAGIGTKEVRCKDCGKSKESKRTSQLLTRSLEDVTNPEEILETSVNLYKSTTNMSSNYKESSPPTKDDDSEKSKLSYQTKTKSLKSNKMETKTSNYSITINSDDTDHEIQVKPLPVKSKFNQSTSSKTKQTEQKNQDKFKEPTKVASKEKDVSSLDARDSFQTVEEKPDYSGNKHNDNANQEFQNLLEKVRKYEKVLETSDKVLKNKSPTLVRTVSDTSSAESATKIPINKNKPLPKCSNPNCSCRQLYRQCACGKLRKRKTSKIEALQFDAATPIVLPKFLVVKDETQPENCSSTEQIEGEKRLEAGHNLWSFENSFSVISFSRSSMNLQQSKENFDDTRSLSCDSEQIVKVNYLICTECKNQWRCTDCCRKKPGPRSKIPRLVSYGSLLHDKLYKISHILTKEFSSDCTNNRN